MTITEFGLDNPKHKQQQKWNGKGKAVKDSPQCKGSEKEPNFPTLYKAYNNQLLDVLRDRKIGAMIGTTYIGCPTVADDIALISDNPEDLQHALYFVQNETQKDKVTINA